MKKTISFSNLSNKKLQKPIYTNIKTSTNRSSKKNKTNKEKKHSKIFNYDGLKTAVYKYNSIKSDNKSINTEIPIKPNINLKNENEIKSNNEEKILYITKLREMNSNMDLILTGLKDNLENNKNIKRKNIINIDDFIEQIDNNKDLQKKYFENSFSFMNITNFHFEIIHKKKYFIDINKLNKDEITKLKYIYDNDNISNNKLDLDEIINDLYDYRNKFEDLKNKNNLNLYNDLYDENYFNEIIKKRNDFYEIEKNNEILRNEINILIEGLTNSFYNGDLLLNRYYNKLKQIDESVQNNIDDINNDILK